MSLKIPTLEEQARLRTAYLQSVINLDNKYGKPIADIIHYENQQKRFPNAMELGMSGTVPTYQGLMVSQESERMHEFGKNSLFDKLLGFADVDNANKILALLEGQLNRAQLKWLNDHFAKINKLVRENMPKNVRHDVLTDYIIGEVVKNVPNAPAVAQAPAPAPAPAQAPAPDPPATPVPPRNPPPPTVSPQRPGRKNAPQNPPSAAPSSSSNERQINSSSDLRVDDEELNARIDKYLDDGLIVFYNETSDEFRVVDPNVVNSNHASKNKKLTDMMKKIRGLAGKGLKKPKQPKKDRKQYIKFVMRGSGALEVNLDDGSRYTKDEYVRLNKFMLNKTKLLDDNEVVLKYIKNRDISCYFPKTKVSDQVKDMISDIADDKFHQQKYDELTDAERRIVLRFCDACHIDIGKTSDEDLQKTFEILKGEFEAGNTNAIQQMKYIISDMINSRQINMKAGLKLLSDL